MPCEFRGVQVLHPFSAQMRMGNALRGEERREMRYEVCNKCCEKIGIHKKRLSGVHLYRALAAWIYHPTVVSFSDVTILFI